MTARLEAVVFDLDGLLVNTEDLYLEASERMLRRRGKVHDALLRERMMGRPVADALQIMIDHHQLTDTIEALATETREVFDELMDTSLSAMPGLYELLDDLDAAGLSMAVATSATRGFADDVLTRLAIGDRFRFVLSAEDIERGKPAPDVYLLAAARLGLPPSRMMVLEDSGNGCRAALAAGAFTVAVPNEHTRHHDFTGVALVADSLADPRIREALAISVS